MWRQFNGTLARESGFRGLSFGYRLAPEYPFPTAIEDCVAGYIWLLGTGVNPKNIALVGDSAGGALVLSVLMVLRDRKLPMPACGAPMSPWTDLELKGETMKPETGDPLTTEDSARSMAIRFLGGADARHPWASALYGDVSGLPPLHIEAGERDVLFADSTRLVKRLKDAGTEHTFEAVPGAIHSFPALASRTPEAAGAFKRMAAFMNRHTGR
jgi:acetyl esterase/lipase